MYDTFLPETLATLQRGGLILYPTDTIWGIGCDATDAEAIGRIYRLKRRDDSKSLIILLADAQRLPEYVADPSPEILHYLEKAERPTTVIYEGARGLPSNLVSADGSIGIRVVKEPFCQALIRQLGKPLVSTSANISGQPAPKNFGEIDPAIKGGVDYVVPYRREDVTEVPPSRIIRAAADGTIKVLR